MLWQVAVNFETKGTRMTLALLGDEASALIALQSAISIFRKTLATLMKSSGDKALIEELRFMNRCIEAGNLEEHDGQHVQFRKVR